jgi:hypothetical protein
MLFEGITEYGIDKATLEIVLIHRLGWVSIPAGQLGHRHRAQEGLLQDVARNHTFLSRGMATAPGEEYGQMTHTE